MITLVGSHTDELGSHFKGTSVHITCAFWVRILVDFGRFVVEN